MKDIDSQISDFEREYIQEYATQFDVTMDLNFLRGNSPKILNNYSNIKQPFFFPSNRSEEKQLQIQEKYTQFNQNRIFFLLKVAKDNTPLAFDFIEAELINHQNTNLLVNINIAPSDHFDYNAHNKHANKKTGQQLTRQQLICYHGSGRFQSLFNINVKHVCDLRLNY